uniref:Uncharacterized protein n=1 Tax=Euplotes harpa TaxID=151035 RepID=A0A7S3NBR4_9SPIT|mmetsp:Transcript_33818/g.39003  ORF Transcript_33818/g.39003 Transcript_33818/m.39003 type:complete len:108 (+) Transcript_33818:901-1224(+)
MIMPNAIKHAEHEDVYNKMLDEFSSLLYKYSIKKLAAFVSNPSVSFVLRQFNQNSQSHSGKKGESKNPSEISNEKGAFKYFLESDVTLSKNKQLYIKAWKEILRMID